MRVLSGGYDSNPRARQGSQGWAVGEFLDAFFPANSSEGLEVIAQAFQGGGEVDVLNRGDVVFVDGDVCWNLDKDGIGMGIGIGFVKLFEGGEVSGSQEQRTKS